MAEICKNPQGTEKMFESKTNASFPNEDMKSMKSGPTYKSGSFHSDRNVDPANQGGYRSKMK